MRTVGIDGGSFLCELGPASDVVVFFRCVEKYVAKSGQEQNFKLLTDRFYRRYLRREELASAAVLMERVEQAFAQVHTNSLDWHDIGLNSTLTRLDLSQPTLAEVFAKFFSSFARCKESAEIFFNSWNIYQPVKIVMSDQPWFMVEKNRPLQDYDELEGKPFWLR